MVNNILGVSISLLIMLLIRTPAFKYCYTVVKGKPFKSYEEFVVFSLLHLLFLCDFSIFYYFLIIGILFNIWNSLIPAFFFIQMIYYIIIVTLFVIVHFIIILIKMLSSRFTFINLLNFKVIRKLYEKTLMKLFETTYFIPEENTNIKEILCSVRFRKLRFLFTYLFSGLLVISSASNELLLKAKILTTSVVASSIFNRDIQTYSNFFIMSVLPLALRYFIKNGADSSHKS